MTHHNFSSDRDDPLQKLGHPTMEALREVSLGSSHPARNCDKNNGFYGIHVGNIYLEDHPMTRKWLITMVIVSPLTGVSPLPNGLFMAYKWGLRTTY